MRTLGVWLLILAAIGIAVPAGAEDVNATKRHTGHITGTATDVNGGTVPGATIVLKGAAGSDPRTIIANSNGYFDFKDLDAGTYQVTIMAEGFGGWTSPEVTVAPGQYVILTGSKLKVAELLTQVSVEYSPEKVATEQVLAEEHQRVLGFIPNFYVVYAPDPEPLTKKLKFQLALKTATDPVTLTGVAFLAAVNQAADTPNYGQGWSAYGKRVGAVGADGFSDIMIGGAILPTLLHQDPRYFYQGTGTNKSRLKHALSSPFICHGDNGKLQPNYSSLGGDLASAGLSAAYYPASDRGAGLVFQGLMITTAERMLNTVVQEFVLHKFMPKATN